MKYQEIKEKTVAELQRLLKSHREQLREMRFKIANKQLKNIREFRQIKKEIAEVLTILNNSKDNGENKSQKPPLPLDNK